MARWKLESSATNHVDSSREASSPVTIVPMLPTVSALSPPARRSSAVRVVVVVLPLVPVMPTQRSGLSRKANSGSPTTSRACAFAVEKKPENSEMPGEATTRS